MKDISEMTTDDILIEIAAHETQPDIKVFLSGAGYIAALETMTHTEWLKVGPSQSPKLALEELLQAVRKEST